MGFLDARSGVGIRIPRCGIVYMALSCDERVSDTRVARYGVNGSARYLNLEGLILQGTMGSFVLVKRYCVIESKLDIGLREGNWRFVGYTGMMQTVLRTNMIGIDNTQSLNPGLLDGISYNHRRSFVQGHACIEITSGSDSLVQRATSCQVPIRIGTRP
ncbi:hypothetical protein IQ07DRAFT_106985 [Pyrenochaeta sp. DS3sAY3a]|nr:hypothetical protein IQ07DRAFT_106985 [Pyrenochaeta sp. DS3sAY3a]